MKVTFEFETRLQDDAALLELSERLEMLGFVYKNIVEKGRNRSLFNVGAGVFNEDGSKFIITEITR